MSSVDIGVSTRSTSSAEENVSTSPVGRLRTGIIVARSASTASTSSPVTNCVRSSQCEPMSPTARSSPPFSFSSRQFQSVSKRSQSCR